MKLAFRAAVEAKQDRDTALRRVAKVRQNPEVGHSQLQYECAINC